MTIERVLRRISLAAFVLALIGPGSVVGSMIYSLVLQFFFNILGPNAANALDSILQALSFLNQFFLFGGLYFISMVCWAAAEYCADSSTGTTSARRVTRGIGYVFMTISILFFGGTLAGGLFSLINHTNPLFYFSVVQLCAVLLFGLTFLFLTLPWLKSTPQQTATLLVPTQSASNRTRRIAIIVGTLAIFGLALVYSPIAGMFSSSFMNRVTGSPAWKNALITDSYASSAVNDFASALQQYYLSHKMYPEHLEQLLVQNEDLPIDVSIDDPLMYGYGGLITHVDRTMFENDIKRVQYKRSSDGKHFVLWAMLLMDKEAARNARPAVRPTFQIEKQYMGVNCAESKIFCRTDEYVCTALQDCKPFEGR